MNLKELLTENAEANINQWLKNYLKKWWNSGWAGIQDGANGIGFQFDGWRENAKLPAQAGGSSLIMRALKL